MYLIVYIIVQIIVQQKMMKKKRKVTFSRDYDHLTIIQFVNACKQKIVDGDEDLQNFSKAFLQGYFFLIVVQYK